VNSAAIFSPGKKGTNKKDPEPEYSGTDHLASIKTKRSGARLKVDSEILYVKRGENRVNRALSRASHVFRLSMCPVVWKSRETLVDSRGVGLLQRCSVTENARFHPDLLYDNKGGVLLLEQTAEQGT